MTGEFDKTSGQAGFPSQTGRVANNKEEAEHQGCQKAGVVIRDARTAEWGKLTRMTA